MTPLRRARAWARRQHGPISSAQLRQCGLSKEAVRHLERKGWLLRVHRGVYAFGPLNRDGQLVAAILAGARGAGLREGSAAWTLGLDRHWVQPVQLVVPRRVGGAGPAGVDVVHRAMPETDFTSRRGIRTTSRRRTILDSAPDLSPEALRTYLQNAERQGFDIRRLDEPGIPRNLRAALDLYVRGSGLTANELEALFYELCARAGLPLPRKQAAFGDQGDVIRVDFIWNDIRLIVETDGRDGHAGWVAAAEDRARDRRLRRAGYEVARFTWAEVRFQPDMVTTELVEIHRRLRAKVGL